MRTLLTILAVLVLIIGSAALYITSTTGYFSTTENYSAGKVIDTYTLYGAEDIAISRSDSFLIISATDRAQVQSDKAFVNGLYFVDLTVDEPAPVLLTESLPDDFSPHGISLYKMNDAYRIAAINHSTDGHSIEMFTWKNGALTHDKTLKDPTMISPNDLVLTSSDAFYFTNDHGHPDGFMRFLEDYGGFAFSNVMYFDGNSYQQTAEDIAYANGINYDRQRQLLYVASPRDFLIKVYNEQSPGQLGFIENIDCGTGVDNIELDEKGILYSAGHPNLLGFSSYAQGKTEIAPSEVVRIQYNNPGDFSMETIYSEDGALVSATSVACPFGDKVLIGTVMDKEVIVLQFN